MRGKANSSGALKRWLVVTPLLVGAACGGPQKLGGAGTACFRDDECEPGLICVAPEADDPNRVCSNDPTPLISEVDGPPPVEMPMGGAAGMAGAMVVAGGGMVGMAGGGAPSAGSAGSPAAGNAGAGGGGGGTDTAGSSGSGGTDTAGSGGSGGSGGTAPEGGAPN